MGAISNWLLTLAQNTVMRLDRQKQSLKHYLENDYALSIANTRLVASRALLANCDIHSANPQSSEIDLDYLASIPKRVSALSNLGRPISVYVCSDALVVFANQVLPQITTKFVLVSGDSDLEISSKTLGAAFEAIANHSLLLAWFAQNADTQHPKLHALPIGLDFHSRWRDAQIWGGGVILPAMQEAELRQIVQRAPRWSERKLLGYCNWGVSLNRGDRQECKAKMDQAAYFYQTQRLSRSDTWTEQSQYAFVISPSGAGMDCHRTWEALALGCAPIVKASPMASMFEGLPVILVEDWAQVTPGFLQESAKRMQREVFDCSKLLLAFWTHQIRSNELSQTLPALRCTLDQMKEIVL